MTNVFMDFLGKMESLINRTREETERAISSEQVYSQISQAVYEKFDYGWLMDWFIEDGGESYAVVVSGGRLYRMNFTLDNGAVGEIAEPVEVMVDFPERVRTKNDFVIRKTPEGRNRWISYSATATLNRVGEIDSTALFDSMVEQFDAEAEDAPIRQLYHLGEHARTGTVDFLMRIGTVLVASGLYDETELAAAEIKARKKDPDFWGDSIGYQALAHPEIIDIAGVEIPVYESGILREISTLAESDAASWFTSMPYLLTEEVVSMERLNAQQKLNLLRVFEGDDDAETKAQALIDGADAVDRAVKDAQMITRTTESETVETEETETEETETEETETETEETETEDSPAPLDGEIVLDDEAVDAIAARSAELTNETLTGLNEKLDALLEKHETEVERLNEALTEVKTRLTTAEEIADNLREIEDADSPIASTLRVAYRPRSQNDPEKSLETPPLEQRGEGALEKIRAASH